MKVNKGFTKKGDKFPVLESKILGTHVYRRWEVGYRPYLVEEARCKIGFTPQLEAAVFLPSAVFSLPLVVERQYHDHKVPFWGSAAGLGM